MQVRDARREDLTALSVIHVDAWRKAYRDLMPDAFLAALDDKHARSRLEPAMGYLPPRVLVAECEDVVVGFCRLGPSREGDVPDDCGEIFAINIAPAHWRSGYGRVLMTSALERLRELGKGTVTLWVLLENHRAHRFYEALGFARDGATRVEAADSDWPLSEIRYRLTF